jgi:hypothetical protein
VTAGARAIWLPLAFYLTGSLAVPALNGAGAHAEFWPHAVTVLAVAAAFASAAHAALRWPAARCARIRPPSSLRRSVEVLFHRLFDVL